MKIKHSIAFVLFLLTLPSANARVIPVWSYRELAERSDLIAVVDVSSITKTNIASDPWGGAYSHQKIFQGQIAHLETLWIIKGDQKLKYLDLLFFTYAGIIREPNGADLISFDHTEQHRYLIFLRKDASGWFVPTTGQCDATLSIKVIQGDIYLAMERQMRQK